jgi:hypothetical protein
MAKFTRIAHLLHRPGPEGLSSGGAIIQPEGIIRVLCMLGYEPSTRYTRQSAVQDRGYS